MSGADLPHNYDPAELVDLREDEEMVHTLVGEYLSRREAGASPMALLPDFQARASEHGEGVHDALVGSIAFYEAARFIWPDDVVGHQPEDSMRDGLGFSQ